MGQTQYYGLAKTPNYGLDYESMIKALARVLPEAYANKQIAASRDASNTAALDYYNKMTEIGNRENELTADQIALNKDSMEAAQDAQLQQTGLGLLGTGISAYGLYKNASLAKQIANAGKDIGGEVINTEPGILSKTWDGAKGLASSAYDKLFGPTIDPSTAINLGLESTSNVIPGTVDMAAGWEAIPAMESGAALNIAEGASNITPVLENSTFMAPDAAYAGGELASQGALSTAGSIVSRALPVIAIVSAANMARDKWGGTNKDYREKSAKERFFDDPGMGLGANVMGAIFGDKSEMARIPMQVGEQFSHYAGGPISKAFKGDFEGGVRELVNAPQTSLESFGVDKKTAETINLVLNPGKVIKKIWDSIF
jgi:hypothetical protein